VNRECFNELVRRLEQFAERRPSQYKLRCGALALLGYGYILAVLVVVLGLLALAVGIIVSTGRIHGGMVQLVIALVVFTGIILRSLWVSFPPPDAIPVRRADAPRIFELVDEMRRKLKTPAIHHVGLDGSFNAGVIQRPRLGWFGWHQNYLILGLSLLEALPPEQFRAVLAHELGHLSGNHGRFGSWIYRVRQSWSQLLDNLQQSGRGAWVFGWFLRWFAPQFNAYSFVLARAHEYEADRCSVELAGASHTAAALLTFEVQNRRLNDAFWPDLYKQVNANAAPPSDPYSAMALNFRAPLSPLQRDRWLREALRAETNNDDTHPSLTDRLRNLGVSASDVESRPIQTSAAEHFLGDRRAEYTTCLAQRWRKEIEPQWSERHKQAQEELAQLAALDAQTATLSLNEALQRAQLTQTHRGDDAAMPLFREILAAHPDHPIANYQLGQILLSHDDEAGIAHIERAMTLDSDATLTGCGLLFDYFNRHDRDDDAKRCRERAERYQELLALAQQERATVTPTDKFAPHGLDDEAVKQLQAQLAGYAEVRTVYLARKAVEHLPQKPFFVIVIVRACTWRETLNSAEGACAALADRIARELRLPCGDGRIFVVPKRRHKLAKALQTIPGSRIAARA